MNRAVKKRLKKGLRISVVCMVILLFLLALTIMLGSILKDEKQLSPWGTGFFTILTGSMEPAIPAGSLVYVISVPEDKIKENDILTYYAVNGIDIVTHRVIDVNESESGREIVTKGDANTIADPAVYYNRVIGRVAFSFPGVGSLADVFQATKLLGAVITGSGLTLCILGFLGSTKKKGEDSNSDM